MKAFGKKYKDGTGIDWPAVAKDYDGIEIKYNVHGWNKSIGWYYVWDISSGCIWNVKDEKIEQIDD
jgi:hypothetical protein